MYRYSLNQKKSVLSILGMAMVLGDDVSQKRIAYMEAVAETIQLYDLEGLSDFPTKEAFATIDAMPLRDKARFAIVLYQMFMADGVPINNVQRSFFDFVDKETHIKSALKLTGMIRWVAGLRQLF